MVNRIKYWFIMSIAGAVIGQYVYIREAPNLLRPVAGVVTGIEGSGDTRYIYVEGFRIPVGRFEGGGIVPYEGTVGSYEAMPAAYVPPVTPSTAEPPPPTEVESVTPISEIIPEGFEGTYAIAQPSGSLGAEVEATPIINIPVSIPIVESVAEEIPEGFEGVSTAL